MTAQLPRKSVSFESNGEQDAAKALYRKYAPAMYNLCLRILQHPQDAEDLLQESFAQVFTHLDSFRAESTIGAWIKRIVVNCCLNHLKKRRIPLVFEEPPEVADEPQSRDEESFSGTVELVRDAISRLPEGYRIVLTLHVFEGYTHREIAEQLEIAESTAKTQYMRARQKVRLWVNNQLQNS